MSFLSVACKVSLILQKTAHFLSKEVLSVPTGLRPCNELMLITINYGTLMYECTND